MSRPFKSVTVTGRALLIAITCYAPVATHSQNAGVWERSHLLGDPGHIRTQMHASGLEPFLNYNSTWMGNVSGGAQQGGAYKGNLTAGLNLNLDRALGWRGSKAFVSGVNTHGESLSGRFVQDSLGTRKDDEADSTHLFEFGWEQNLWSDKFSLKAGQLAATADFFQSSSGFFTHDSLNWGPNGQSSAPGGPDASLGMRLRLKLAEEAYLLAGVYDNSTSGNFGTDSNDKHGTKWNLPVGERAVWLAEAGYTPAQGLFQKPSILKAGVWLDQQDHADNLTGAMHDNNWGLFTVAEQVLWADADNAAQNFRTFARFTYAAADYNKFAGILNAGALYTGLIPGREQDVVGLGFTHAETSSSWRQATGAGRFEEAIELKYQLAVAPWWRVDLFTQYLIQPGSPDARQLDDAFVLGIGSSLNF